MCYKNISIPRKKDPVLSLWKELEGWVKFDDMGLFDPPLWARILSLFAVMTPIAPTNLREDKRMSTRSWVRVLYGDLLRPSEEQSVKPK